MENITFSMESILNFLPLIISGVFGLFMRASHIQHKLYETRIDALESELQQYQKAEQENRTEFWKALNAIRDAVQHTRENYVTNQRFEKFIDGIKEDLKHILEKLDNKPNRNDCHDCKKT